MRRLIALLLDPGSPDRWPPVIARLVLVAIFLPAGIGKFTNHDAYITRFDRWGFPEPGTVAYLVGTIEIVCAVLMLVGLLPRLVGLVLVGNMVGALATAGRVDGGQDVWLPLILIAISGFVVAVGGGRLALGNPFGTAGPRPASG